MNKNEAFGEKGAPPNRHLGFEDLGFVESMCFCLDSLIPVSVKGLAHTFCLAQYLTASEICVSLSVCLSATRVPRSSIGMAAQHLSLHTRLFLRATLVNRGSKICNPFDFVVKV